MEAYISVTHRYYSAIVVGLIWVIVAWALSLVLWQYFSIVEDELSSFTWLFCRHTPYLQNQLFTWWNHCSYVNRDLWLLNITVPAGTSSWYVGGITAFPYWPIHALWTHPASVRFYGLLVLLVHAAVIARMFRYRFSIVALGLLLFMPYVFSHAIDTGPSKVGTTALIVSYALLLSWIGQPRFRYILGIGLLTAIGVWAKLNYVWVLPGLALLGIVEFVIQHSSWSQVPYRKMVVQLLGAILCGAGVLALYLFSISSQSGRSEILPNTFSFPSLGFREWLVGGWAASSLFSVLSHPFRAFLWSVNYLPDVWMLRWYFPVLFGVLLFILLSLAAVRFSAWRVWMRPVSLYGAFVVSFLYATKSPNANMMHHVILLLPFFVLSMFSLGALLRFPVTGKSERFEKTLLLLGCAAFLLFNGYAFFALRGVPTSRVTEQRALHALLDHPSFVQEYITVILDYRVFYIQGLFGNREQHIVRFENFRKPETVEQLKELLQKERRRVAFVYWETSWRKSTADLDLLRSSFSLSECAVGFPSFGIRVMLERPDQPGNPCF